MRRDTALIEASPQHASRHRRGRVALFVMGACLAFATVAAVPASRLAPATSASGQGTSVRAVQVLVDAGRFADARNTIDATLARPGTDAATAEALRFERERMRRILLDFTLSADEVRARVAERIPDLTDAEFAAWDEAGLFERMTIDGRTL